MFYTERLDMYHFREGYTPCCFQSNTFFNDVMNHIAHLSGYVESHLGRNRLNETHLLSTGSYLVIRLKSTMPVRL